MITVPYAHLGAADLRVDAIYQGGRSGNAGDDPLGPLLGVSNSGGFRYLGSIDRLKLVVLTTSLSEPDWPDELDRETGVFTYYGDNRHPGRALHETPRRGNLLLSRIFEDAHGGPDGRRRVPPVLLFAKADPFRDVEFLGLAVPGAVDLRSDEDLVAVWKATGGKRFQNYRARFTVLNVGEISRSWIEAVSRGDPALDLAPKAWRDWVIKGRLQPLIASRSLEHRTEAEQLPSDEQGRAIVAAIHAHFDERPHDFEHCAAALARMMLGECEIDVTRPSRDGGRDGVGWLRVGQGPGAIKVDFALEAKCYGLRSTVGVKDLSRLISRLRHRQFGILVTTNVVARQAYKEIKEDQHPIIVMAAVDIIAVLKAAGLADQRAVRAWLEADFPLPYPATLAVADGTTSSDT